jgi:hypothetical protein
VSHWAIVLLDKVPVNVFEVVRYPFTDDWIIVLATSLGNPLVVQVLRSSLVWFGSRPGQKPDPLCLRGIVTLTGHEPAVFWPGSTWTEIPYYGPYQIVRSLAPIQYLSSDHIVT